MAAWAGAKGSKNRHALGKRGHILNLSLHFNPPLSQAKRATESIDEGSSKRGQKKMELKLQKFAWGVGGVGDRKRRPTDYLVTITIFCFWDLF